jgi:hypothetical protein
MGHLLKIKCVDSRINVHILDSTGVLFTLTTVQVPKIALTHTKRITVYSLFNGDWISEPIQGLTHFNPSKSILGLLSSVLKLSCDG